MVKEFNEVKRYLGARFGIGNRVPDGIYAVPTNTSKGRAFMRFECRDEKPFGDNNFKLYWDEGLKISWYDAKKPLFRKESKFARAYRKLKNQF